MPKLYLSLVLVIASASGATAQPHASGSNGARSAYAALVAAEIRRHTPLASKLGEGQAACRFRVGQSGEVSWISCTASSARHERLLWSVIEATHTPPPPGGSFLGEQSVHFH